MAPDSETGNQHRPHPYNRHAALLALREARWHEVERQLAQYQGVARQLGTGHYRVTRLFSRLQRARVAARQVEELVVAVEQQRG